MIDYETVSVFFRGAERLFVVLSGALSIWMGWNLFKSNIVQKGDGAVTVGNWKVELKQVGPGIFFAAFGAIILYGSWATPLKFPEKPLPNSPGVINSASPKDGGRATARDATSNGFIFLSHQEQRDGRAFSLAVNELVHFSNEYCKEIEENKPDCKPRLISGIIKAYRDKIVIPKAFSKKALRAARTGTTPSAEDHALSEEVREYYKWINKRMEL